MRLKLLSLITALTLMGTTAAIPSKVAAQGLVEYAVILVLVAMNSDEILELRSAPGLPDQLPQVTGPTLVYTNTIQLSDTLPGADERCEKTVQVVVKAPPGGIIPINVAPEENFQGLVINGENVMLDECFHGRPSINVAVVKGMGDKAPIPVSYRLSDMENNTITIQSLTNDRSSLIGPPPFVVIPRPPK